MALDVTYSGHRVLHPVVASRCSDGLFPGGDAPRQLGPQTEEARLLSDMGALPAGSSPLGPGFSCRGDHRQALFQSFEHRHINTAKEGIPSGLDYLVRYY